MKHFDFIRYVKNNPLLNESISEGPAKLDTIVKKLNSFATQYNLKPSKKLAKGDIAKWVLPTGEFVRLYNDGGELAIHFDAVSGISGNDPVSYWLQPTTWENYFYEDSDDDEEWGDD